MFARKERGGTHTERPGDDVGPPPRRSVQGRLAAGHRLDRFVIREFLGAGGIGEVYSAYDVMLDRRVAIKLLRDPNHAGRSSQRLLREAQATARLHHPNVVDIFDVGFCGRDLFIAMEQIDGEPMASWLTKAPSLDEILKVFEQAGAGLAAAHTVGVVHRDFKPSNVLVGNDGVARVIDFGLARSFGPPAAGAGDPRGGPRAGGLLNEALTDTGMVVGTPAYMAPEQLRGGNVDARADQFSFAVSLVEAICGSRPRTSIKGTKVGIGMLLRSRFARNRTAHRIWPVLQRALASSPAHRFSSVDELMTELHAARNRPRRQLLAVGLAGMVVIAGLSIGAGLAPGDKWVVTGAALESAKAAVARCNEKNLAPAYCAGARFSLARGLQVTDPQSGAEARDLAIRALNDFRALGWQEDALAVERWLEHQD